MMNYGRIREAHVVNTTWLPSKGVCYPQGIEIAVSPISVAERKAIEGASQATYYKKILDCISVYGDFDKKNLLFHDVSFLDLVCRLYTFEKDKKINISDYVCPHCGSKEAKMSFDMADLEFEDFKEGIFGEQTTLKNEETGEEVIVTTPGKAYTFSDGMTVYARPMTVGNYIDMSIEYMSNFNEARREEMLADLYTGMFSYLIIAVKDREYKDDAARREFIVDYIRSLYKDSDSNILDQIENDMSIIMKPITGKCPECNNKLEVYVNPSLRFQQEV